MKTRRHLPRNQIVLAISIQSINSIRISLYLNGYEPPREKNHYKKRVVKRYCGLARAEEIKLTQGLRYRTYVRVSHVTGPNEPTRGEEGRKRRKKRCAAAAAAAVDAEREIALHLRCAIIGLARFSAD